MEEEGERRKDREEKRKDGRQEGGNEMECKWRKKERGRRCERKGEK